MVRRSSHTTVYISNSLFVFTLMKKIGEIIFADLPTEVQISASVRPKYIKEGDPIPKKYNNLYHEFIDGYLCELQNNTRIVKNADKAGKPNIVKIGGDKLHELVYTDSPSARTRIIKAKELLNKYFTDNMKTVKITIYPVHIELKFYISEKNPLDRDNLALMYEKSFFDSIQTEIFEGRGKKKINPVGFMPNDDIEHINAGTSKAFFTTRNPYMIANFYQYESVEEYNNDKANVVMNKKTIDSVQALAERFATYNLRNNFREKELYSATGELNAEPMTYYQREYEFYFKQLSNEFL